VPIVQGNERRSQEFATKAWAKSILPREEDERGGGKVITILGREKKEGRGLGAGQKTFKRGRGRGRKRGPRENIQGMDHPSICKGEKEVKWRAHAKGKGTKEK